MKQNISPAAAAIIIAVVVAIVIGIYVWQYRAAPQATAMKPPSMLPPQFRSMSTKDPVPPNISNQPVQGGSLAPPGLGSSGPTIQSGGMMPGAPPTPGGAPPLAPGTVPSPR